MKRNRSSNGEERRPHKLEVKSSILFGSIKQNMPNHVEHNLVLAVLKAGVKNRIFLTDFEQRFIAEGVERFRRYGKAFSVRGRQWKVFNDLADKLDLDVERVDLDGKT